MNDQDELIYLDEDVSSGVASSSDVWRILVVDDDKDVHSATLLAISDLKIQGRSLQFLHAYSSAQAQEILQTETDIAVILLDVVMEKTDSGLQLVFYIRNTLKQTDVRIILRTGQPGYTPEMATIRDYDINDYRTKSELTRTKLFTAVTVAIRSYEQIRASSAAEIVKSSEKQIRYMLESSPVAVQVMNFESKTLTFANQSSADLFKLPFEKILGTNPSIFYQSQQDFEELIARLHLHDNILNIPLGMRTCEGSEIWVLASYIHVNYDDAPCILSWIYDVTEIKLAADKLRESEGLYREQSITDELSKLYNVRHFHQQIEIEIARSQRYNRPLSLMFLDVDNFKNYNDTYGHQEGDKVLMCLGEVIGECLRHTDSGYRYGGEEFVVLLPETALAGAQIIAERLRKLFEARIFSPPDTTGVHCTVSIGIAERKDSEHADTFIQRADAATYEAKHAGKNRVVAKP